MGDFDKIYIVEKVRKFDIRKLFDVVVKRSQTWLKKILTPYNLEITLFHRTYKYFSSIGLWLTLRLLIRIVT